MPSKNHAIRRDAAFNRTRRRDVRARLDGPGWNVEQQVAPRGASPRGLLRIIETPKRDGSALQAGSRRDRNVREYPVISARRAIHSFTQQTLAARKRHERIAEKIIHRRKSGGSEDASPGAGHTMGAAYFGLTLKPATVPSGARVQIARAVQRPSRFGKGLAPSRNACGVNRRRTA